MSAGVDQNRIFADAVAPAQKLYGVRPHMVGNLSQAQREFISSFLLGQKNMAQIAHEFGVAGHTLKVEFTFEDGRKGGLTFLRQA